MMKCGSHAVEMRGNILSFLLLFVCPSDINHKCGMWVELEITQFPRTHTIASYIIWCDFTLHNHYPERVSREKNSVYLCEFVNLGAELRVSEQMTRFCRWIDHTSIEWRSIKYFLYNINNVNVWPNFFFFTHIDIHFSQYILFFSIVLVINSSIAST